MFLDPTKRSTKITLLVKARLSCWRSAGKTTFVKHLLQREYPGINIGPEPTTDRFVVVMDGMEERRTPGNTLIVQPDKPFQARIQLLQKISS